MMKILYLCGLYSEELQPVFNSNLKQCRLQDAANVFQHAVLEGLVENGVDFYVLSFPFLPCFPHNFGRMRVPGGRIIYEGRTVGESVSYSSLILYKPLSIKKQVDAHVREWIRNNIKDNEHFTVLIYSYEYFFVEPLLQLKEEFPNMQLVSIVTDLYDDAMAFNSNRSLLKQIQLRYESRRMRNCLKGIDRFILLTSDMTERIPEAVGRNIVIEGIYRNSDSIAAGTKMSGALLYTGTFQEFAGVKTLVDAFMMTSGDDFRLILCGSGPCSDYISSCAAKDSRIELRGRVSRDEAVGLQKSVSLLVNPRQPNGGITKYSFPSKTMEYMSSGTPMIGYRLEGIPDEYFQYIYVPENMTVESLAHMIEQVLTLPEDVLRAKGAAAREFILKNKTAQAQLRKLIDFINS